MFNNLLQSLHSPLNRRVKKKNKKNGVPAKAVGCSSLRYRSLGQKTLFFAPTKGLPPPYAENFLKIYNAQCRVL